MKSVLKLIGVLLGVLMLGPVGAWAQAPGGFIILPHDRHPQGFTLVDASSIRRDGDAVAFDQLSIFYIANEICPVAGPCSRENGGVHSSRVHYVVSCGLRAWRQVGGYETLVDHSARFEALPLHGDWETAAELQLDDDPIVDALCNGKLPVGERLDAATPEMAATLAKSMLAPFKGDDTPFPTPSPNDWAPRGPAAFAALPVVASGGARLLVDLAHRRVEGPRVTLPVLTVLGAADLRAAAGYSNPEYRMVASLAMVRFDCSRRVVIPLLQSGFDVNRQVIARRLRATPPRPASQSPLLAAELNLICRQGGFAAAPGDRVFTSWQAAWDG